VMAMFTRGDAFTAEEKARNFAYYEPLTVRDSSLSACVQAIIAAEVGHTELAYDYLGEAALMDLDDLEHNTRDGVHIASLAGAWTGLVAGFGGLRDVGGQLRFAPRLPEALGRLAFRLGSQGRRVHVEVVGEEVTYLLRDGDDLVIRHYDDELTLTAGAPVTLPVPPAPKLKPVTQPAGRVPARRTPSSFTR
jgi:alpha,alpha-trehalose phosphorylase